MPEAEDNSIYMPQPTVYGKIIRERGTRNAVLLLLAFLLLRYGYSSFHAYQMNQVKWPQIEKNTGSLLVLGLLDKDKPGYKSRFMARESNHSWQIRYRDDEEEDPETRTDKVKEKTQEEQDRGGNAPGASHSVASGSVVSNAVILKALPAVMDLKCFNSAEIETKYEPFLEKNYYIVHVGLTDEGTSRYWQFSSEHDGERLVFLLNDEVITCPKMSFMTTSQLDIEPIWIKEDAQKLADVINKQKR